MKKRFIPLVLVVGLFACQIRLWAQDDQDARNDQNTNAKPATLEDQIAQLQQSEQALKGEIDQLRNDVADLQERVKSLEGDQQKTQPSSSSTIPSRSAHRPASSNVRNSQNESNQGQSFDVFYQGLQSGGHWFDDPTYGYVWQPDVAASDENWRPYTDGHWAYTDRGWTWVSDEDFGWATYHYGRWVRRSDSGWVWIPGGEWAPAWVSWRQSDSELGWAPLPPEVADHSQTPVESWVDNYYDIGPEAYVFIRTRDLAQQSYREALLASTQNLDVFAHSRNVTNINFGRNGVIVNGPQYEQIASRATIPRYKLNYVAANDGRYGIRTQADELQVLAPAVNLQRNASAQPKIEKQLARAALNRGWQRVDPTQAEQLRQSMEKQAPVPSNLPQKPVPPQPVTAAPQNQQSRAAETAPAPSSSPQRQPQTAARPSAVQKPTPAATTEPPTQRESPARRPGTEENRPPSPTPGQNRQIGAQTPETPKSESQETRQAPAPSPTPGRSAEPRERREETASPSRSPEQRNEKSSDEQPRRSAPKSERQPPDETRTNQGPGREQLNQAPRPKEPGQNERPPNSARENSEPRQQPSGERNAERKQTERPTRNERQEKSREEAPKKSESKSREEQHQRSDGQTIIIPQ